MAAVNICFFSFWFNSDN